jgi:hypothetical protein
MCVTSRVILAPLSNTPKLTLSARYTIGPKPISVPGPFSPFSDLWPPKLRITTLQDSRRGNIIVYSGKVELEVTVQLYQG